MPVNHPYTPINTHRLNAPRFPHSSIQLNPYTCPAQSCDVPSYAPVNSTRIDSPHGNVLLGAYLHHTLIHNPAKPYVSTWFRMKSHGRRTRTLYFTTLAKNTTGKRRENAYLLHSSHSGEFQGENFVRDSAYLKIKLYFFEKIGDNQVVFNN